jgi:endonuclease YncB( thermonuclease family)
LVHITRLVGIVARDKTASFSAGNFKMLKNTALLLVLSLATCAPAAEPLTGKVTRVTDGDTIRVLIDRREVIVRLAGIDAPEAGQAYGARAKQALGELVNQKTVRVELEGKDRYGRSIGRVFLEDSSINDKMVELGWAWQYRKYDKSSRLEQLEQSARKKKLGLWAGEAVAIPPWELRRKPK